MTTAHLVPATLLGPYEILAPLGAGGMGEVYRARDTRLDREVAVKVLPAALAQNETFRARFDREAKAISSLSHPHICILHDVGRAVVEGRDVDYLVLELLDGESLAARLARGLMPLEQVLRYAAEIASALDSAHRRGVVHRDVKPANVMLTRGGGGAKLLDFGLARPGESPGVVSGISTVPTEAKPLTEEGTILGTFQYMAPEQLEGKPADARTDIFALGALLYEMASGRRAFEGKDRTSLIAAIVTSQPPPVSELRPTAPPALDHVVRKCLEKDPDERWQSARDVKSELEWIRQGLSASGASGAVLARRRSRERLAWAALTAVLLAAMALGLGRLRPAPSRPQTVRLTMDVPPELKRVGPPNVSPNGRLIAFDAVDRDGQSRIWVRPLEASEARVLPGTEGALRPFWSPDSRFLAFMAAGKLKRIDVSGGHAQTICDSATGADGSWGAGGVIVFDGAGIDPIWSVPASGGVPKAEVAPDAAKGVVTVGWPQFLPDGVHFLYSAEGRKYGERILSVRSLATGETKALFRLTSRAAYARPGHLVFVRGRTLVARRFDEKTLEAEGEEMPLDEGLEARLTGYADFSLAADVLVYRGARVRTYRLMWRDRSGTQTPLLPEAADYGDVWLSPDGKRLVFGLTDPIRNTSDLWIHDLARNATSRFTVDPGDDRAPVWSRDGKRIFFTSDRRGQPDLYAKDVAGTAAEELLYESPELKFASDVSPDGRHLLFLSRPIDQLPNLWALHLDGSGKPFPVVRTPAHDFIGTFSPDGRFVAYQSSQSGRPEVYVQEFPTAADRWQVSTAGGRQPFWRADGKEVLYLSADDKVMAVPVELRPRFSAGTPQALFSVPRASLFWIRAPVYPAPDGKRFVVLTPEEDKVQPTKVVLNWAEALRK